MHLCILDCINNTTVLLTEDLALTCRLVKERWLVNKPGGLFLSDCLIHRLWLTPSLSAIWEETMRKRDCCICLESNAGLFVSEVWFKLHRKMMLANSSMCHREPHPSPPASCPAFSGEQFSSRKCAHTLALQGIDL